MSTILEEAKFIQHHLPGLEAGNYLIAVTNTVLTNTSTNLAYKFAVKGVRYAIDPNIIHSVFPPSNSIGLYDNAIPHVVLTQKSLPWIRTAGDSIDVGKFSYTDSQGDTVKYDTDVPTWLAVLLLNENDFNYEGAPQVDGTALTINNALKTGTVADLIPGTEDTFVSTLSLNGVTSQDTLEVGENTTDACQYIRIPVEVFNFIAPSLNDMKMMANVRQVNIANKPQDLSNQAALKEMQQLGEVTDNQALGKFSIVMGNRLPGPNMKHLAVLVSLDGLGDYLPSDSGGAAQTPLASDTNPIIKLPVFKSWSFTSDANAHNFVAIFEGLNNGDSTTATTNSSVNPPNTYTPLQMNMNNPQLQYYPTATEISTLKSNAPDTLTALNQGYVPINETLRNGQQTVSWYKGPFSPVPVSSGIITPTPLVSKTFLEAGTQNSATENVKSLIAHPDSLLRLDPKTGLFDASYAAAWQLGQLLAIQDSSYSTMLYKWRRETTLKMVQQIDQYLVNQLVSGAIDSVSDAESAAGDGETSDATNEDFYEGVYNLLHQIKVNNNS